MKQQFPNQAWLCLSLHLPWLLCLSNWSNLFMSDFGPFMSHSALSPFSPSPVRSTALPSSRSPPGPSHGCWVPSSRDSSPNFPCVLSVTVEMSSQIVFLQHNIESGSPHLTYLPTPVSPYSFLHQFALSHNLHFVTTVDNQTTSCCFFPLSDWSFYEDTSRLSLLCSA